MTENDKINVDLDVMKIINTLVGPGNFNDAALYIRGDAEFQTASVNIKGDTRLLSQVLHHHIDNNEEFKRFIFATLGSYFAKNIEEEQKFNEGIKLTRHSFGVN